MLTTEFPSAGEQWCDSVQDHVGAEVGQHGGHETPLPVQPPETIPPIPLSTSARTTTSGVRGSTAAVVGR